MSNKTKECVMRVVKFGKFGLAILLATIGSCVFAQQQGQGDSASSPLTALMAKRNQESATAAAEKSSENRNTTTNASVEQAKEKGEIKSKPNKVESASNTPQEKGRAGEKLQSDQNKPKLSRDESHGHVDAKDPINNQSLAYEDLEKALIIKKKQTELAQEEVKRLKAESEIASYASKSPPAKDLAQPVTSSSIIPNATKAKKGKKGKDQPQIAVVPNVPVVTGVMTTKGEVSAIIEIAGQSHYLKTGESIGGFTVDGINGNQVTINGVGYPINVTASRQITVDRQSTPGVQGAAQNAMSGSVKTGPLPSTPLPELGTLLPSAPKTNSIALNNAAGGVSAPPQAPISPAN